MKNTLKLFALVAFMFAAFATSAQTAKPIKLGHLDVQKVMTSMPEFKKAQDDLAAKEQEIRKELTAMHENYQKLMQEYQANAKTLTELSRTAKEQEIQGLAERIQNFQQLAQEQMAKTQEDYKSDTIMLNELKKDLSLFEHELDILNRKKREKRKIWKIEKRQLKGITEEQHAEYKRRKNE